MGEQYRQVLEEKLRTLGGGELRVYIDDASISPHYRKHLEETVLGSGAILVSTREEANFVFDGESAPFDMPGVVTAFIANGQIEFRGAL